MAEHQAGELELPVDPHELAYVSVRLGREALDAVRNLGSGHVRPVRPAILDLRRRRAGRLLVAWPR